MASLPHNMIPPDLFGRIFKLECPADRVSYFKQFDINRDIYRVDFNRMFNNEKMKLECPKMAITPGRNTFNTASYTYSDSVWDHWTQSSTGTLSVSDHSETVATSTCTWITWVRDQYVFYYDTSIERDETRVEAIWSIWTEEGTQALYESVADEVTDGLNQATERLGRAFEHVARSGHEAGEAMRRLGNIGAEIRQEGSERRAREVSEIAKLTAKKEAAEAKAKELLLDIIGANELAVYEETGRVFVKGRKHDYIVQKEGFIQQIQKGKIQDLCASINKSKYPLTDNVVAMKMLIESDEDKFLQIANEQGNRPYDELPKAACM